MKLDINPLNPKQRDVNRLQAARRCSARSKRSGQPCRAPAMRGWTVCRCHGARGGAPKGKRNGRYVHGERSAEAVALRRRIGTLVRVSGELMENLERTWGRSEAATIERSTSKCPAQAVILSLALPVPAFAHSDSKSTKEPQGG